MKKKKWREEKNRVCKAIECREKYIWELGRVSIWEEEEEGEEKKRREENNELCVIRKENSE